MEALFLFRLLSGEGVEYINNPQHGQTREPPTIRFDTS